MEQPRSSLGAAWEQLRSSLEYAYSEITARTSRAYGPCPTRLRLVVTLLLMMVVGVNTVWGQIERNYTGTYYIANYNDNSYSSTDRTNNYYLCPSAVYYDYNGSLANQKPFLTTHKPDDNEPGINNKPFAEQIAKWKIIYETSEDGFDYYYIKYVAPDGTEKYLVHNAIVISGKEARIRYHLQTDKDSDEDNNLFFFTAGYDKARKRNDSFIHICSKAEKSRTNGASLNPAKANTDSYTGQNVSGAESFQQGTTTLCCGGLVGHYDVQDKTGLWFLEDVIKNPVVSINGEGKAVISSTNTGTVSYFYTTNGSIPTTTTGTPFDAENPIDITGVETIKAIAVIDDEVSNVATYTLGNGTPYLIQSQECTAYYMVPGYPSGGNTPINTSSVAGPEMEWYVRDAGAVNGLQYYYIVNKSSSTSSTYSYLYRTGDNIYVQDLSDKLPTDDGYKFYLRSNTDGSYNIYPKALTDKSLYKKNGNIEASNIVLNGSTSHNHAKWSFVPTSNDTDKRSLFETISAHVSPDGDALHYYKIATIGLPDSYIVVTVGSEYAGTSTSETARNMSWELQIADHDDWLNYYHIRSAATGQYMYFTGNTEPVNTNTQTNAVEMKDLSSEEAERYQFVLARATDADYYYIIPRSHKNVFEGNKYYGIWNNTAILQATLHRAEGAVNVKWKFEEADLFCVDPVITRDDSSGEIIITGITNASDIFYTTNNDTPVLPADAETAPTAPTNKYATSFLPEIGVTQIKAQAVVKNDYTVSSSVVTYNFSEYAQPTISYDNENSTITISTDEGARVYYSYGTAPGDPTIDPSVKTQTFTTDAITSTTIVKALAVKEGWAPSAIVTMTVYKPTIELSASTATYNNTNLSPTITVKDGDNDIDAEKYLVSYQKDGEAVSECKDAGTYTVIVSDVEGDNELVSGTTTFTISPAALTITPNDSQSKHYGDPDPVLTYANVGLMEGDELTGALSRAEGESVGNYAIMQGTLDNSNNPNYSITFSSGKTFAITPKSLGSGADPAENITIEITEADADHVVVKQGGESLRAGTDYSITTTGDADTKYYKVTITGANNYAGSFKATFVNLKLSKRFGSPEPGGAATFVSNTDDGDFVVPDNMTAYIVTGINTSAGTVEVEGPLDNIPEGVPVLLLSTVNTNGFIVKTKDNGTAPQGTNLLKVDAADKNVSTGEIYVLYKGEFVLNAEGTLPAGKVYLQKAGGSQAPAVLTIDWGVANGIEEIPFSEPDMQRLDTWYTLEGIKLNGSPAKRGLYLKNGKKTIVK